MLGVLFTRVMLVGGAPAAGHLSAAPVLSTVVRHGVVRHTADGINQ